MLINIVIVLSDPCMTRYFPETGDEYFSEAESAVPVAHASGRKTQMHRAAAKAILGGGPSAGRVKVPATEP